jgi:hypothetical protein
MTTRWSARFEYPIALSDGGELVTLRDAATYLTRLPKAEQEHPAWQLAAATLLDAAEGRDFLMHARISVLRALNRDRPVPARVRREDWRDKWRAKRPATSR